MQVEGGEAISLNKYSPGNKSWKETLLLEPMALEDSTLSDLDTFRFLALAASKQK